MGIAMFCKRCGSVRALASRCLTHLPSWERHGNAGRFYHNDELVQALTSICKSEGGLPAQSLMIRDLLSCQPLFIWVWASTHMYTIAWTTAQLSMMCIKADITDNSAVRIQFQLPLCTQPNTTERFMGLPLELVQTIWWSLQFLQCSEMRINENLNTCWLFWAPLWGLSHVMGDVLTWDTAIEFL